MTVLFLLHVPETRCQIPRHTCNRRQKAVLLKKNRNMPAAFRNFCFIPSLCFLVKSQVDKKCMLENGFGLLLT